MRPWFEKLGLDRLLPVRLTRRAQAWKARVDDAQIFASARFGELGDDIARAEAERDALRADLAALREAFEAQRAAAREERAETQAAFERHEDILRALAVGVFAPLGTALTFERDVACLWARRGDTLRVLRLPAGVMPPAPLGGLSITLVAGLIEARAIARIEATSLTAEGRITRWSQEPRVCAQALDQPLAFRVLLDALAPAPETPAIDPADLYEARRRALAVEPELIDFLALAEATPAAPFAPEIADLAPPRIPAEPVRRAAAFLNNCYYNYKYLAKALRDRGWDAVTVSLEAPASPQQQFFHGEDVNLHDPDPAVMRRKAAAFFAGVPERFGALQFYGQGSCSFFPENYESGERLTRTPWDFMELKRHRTLIGYTVSGCADAGLQSSIRAVTGGVCRRCAWENRPDVCSDRRNGAWIAKLESFCDWIGLEGDWETPERLTPRHVARPVVMALDAELWRPDLEPPDALRLERAPGELLVYHAVGNYSIRRVGDRDIKGTGAVFAAIETLKAEGLPVRLVFAHDIQSRDVRFYQIQADVVVDQLNYGRLGANARETLMLGRPLVTSLNAGAFGLRTIREAPALHADEATIADVLRRVLRDRALRDRMGSAGRAYALRWHEAGACAARYEALIDRLRAGLPPDDDALFPQPAPSGL